MTEEAIETMEARVAKAFDNELSRRVTNFKTTSALVYVLVAGGITATAWVTTLQRSVADNVNAVQALQVQMAQQQAINASTSEDTAVIKVWVGDLKDDMKEMKADIKDWTGK